MDFEPLEAFEVVARTDVAKGASDKTVSEERAHHGSQCQDGRLILTLLARPALDDDLSENDGGASLVLETLRSMPTPPPLSADDRR